MILNMFEIKSLLRKGIRDLEPYVPGLSEEALQRAGHRSEITKLASNENPTSPPDPVIDAICQEARRINRYPAGMDETLAPELAAFLGCGTHELIFGNGAEEIILMACLTFVNEGDPCVIIEHTFDAYETAVRVAGGKVIFSPLTPSFHVDLDDILARITPDTKMVFLPNPNNPTGTVFTKKAFESFLARLPEHVVVLLDEAYHEYVDAPAYPDGMGYIHDAPLIVLRTFSKAYGLAGVRIGYAIARPDIIDMLHHVRLPFNVNRLAQAAAMAALRQRAWVQEHVQKMLGEKQFLYHALKELNLFYISSQTNFILIDTGKNADQVFQALLHHGVIVRPGTIWGLDTFIRLTVGPRRENERFLNALKAIIS